VVGISDAVLGQRVFGFVKLANGAKESVLAEILSNAATRLASYKVPDRLAITDEFPRNSLSKLDRKMLQVMASGLAGRPQIEAIPAQRGQPDKRRVRRTIRIG
jgi:acyl-coenzyme A synthetase/AMP-(fatty) acid ligase